MVEKILRIGIVKPTFTGAAYSGLYNYSTGFYAFFLSPYLNHKPSPPDADYYNYLPYPPDNYAHFGKDSRYIGWGDAIAKAAKLSKQTFVPIADHLEMLSPKIPTTPEEIKHLDEIAHGDRYNPYHVTKIAPHIKELLPDADVVILTDGDIHGGQTSNFDILILGHNEYVTQQEYDNLRNFVADGGILVCLDGNIFFCEVSYNKDAQTATLVRGHRWVFDGQKAYWYKPEMYFEDSGERWQEETSEWLGSNYAYFRDIHGTQREGYSYYLSNGLVLHFGFPSGYSLEDQYITNYDGVKIIQDWGAKSTFPNTPLVYGDVQIACYEKPHGRGKSIIFGFYSDMVLDNPEFLKFFDGVLLGNAIASLTPLPKCDLSHIIKKTLDGKQDTIKQLLNTVEEKYAEIKRIVTDVDKLLDHQKYLEEMNSKLKQAVKDVEILQSINLEHQKTIEEKDDKIRSIAIELENSKAKLNTPESAKTQKYQ